MRIFDIYHDDIMANTTKYTLAMIDQICWERPEDLTDDDHANLLATYIIACANRNLVPVTGY